MCLLKKKILLPVLPMFPTVSLSIASLFYFIFLWGGYGSSSVLGISIYLPCVEKVCSLIPPCCVATLFLLLLNLSQHGLLVGNL